MNIEEILYKVASTDIEDIQQALYFGLAEPYMRHIVDLYDSIWNMTYGASNDPDLIRMGLGELAPRILLLNEQEDLMPNPLVAVEEVEALDLSMFEENDFFPELFRYKNLKTVVFADNDFGRMPKEICQLTQLQKLYFKDGIKEIPSDIINLKALKVLDLSDNQLTEIPDFLQNLFALEELYLAGNYIETLPKFLLHMPKLKLVDVSNNTKGLVDSHYIEAFESHGIELVY